MSRPPRSSDAELLERIDDALRLRTSTDPWGLADVAPAAGISAAGLIKRFGSKERLLHALSRHWIDGIPVAPIDPENVRAELHSYGQAHFATASSSAAIAGLGELMRDLWSPEAAELLREGWDRQARYFEALLRHLPLRGDVDRRTAALTLLDALHGSLYRQAVSLEPTSPKDTIDNLLKGWT
ncbi:MAG: transcriptional regulator, tetR family [Microbacterium sp.]|jgi:AcrR family transcriptional regulator|uniref:TetR/AcrR family transcriptional regulator n=1 Tax=Microbacterium sp. TaxID=51671 RepID=UPI002620C93B|nr:TetR family transcriptional regulator [Microbacterium sp.]MDF2558593.1 transcriptional regulator, tetR family [Microbacterium sp.]